MKIRKALLYLFRRPFTQQLLRWLFVHMNFAIPVQRIIDTPEILAFYHPQPAYTLHILLVPKREIRDFSSLSERDNAVVLELVHAARSLVQQYRLAESEYRIIINGGTHQEVPLLHVHLISDHPVTR